MYAQKNSYTNKHGEYSEYFNYQCINSHRVRGTHCDYKGKVRKEVLDKLIIQLVKILLNDNSIAEKLSKKLVSHKNVDL